MEAKQLLEVEVEVEDNDNVYGIVVSPKSLLNGAKNWFGHE